MPMHYAGLYDIHIDLQHIPFLEWEPSHETHYLMVMLQSMSCILVVLVCGELNESIAHTYKYFAPIATHPN
jgi:hypothetical protein